jgi:hypothetical protein
MRFQVAARIHASFEAGARKRTKDTDNFLVTVAMNC